ncbi:hypothetical protein CALVIDRAFT_526821 [Calocera viscosa TUFC12733]|uniref:Uncharacterized protein n=1 Tax=Calocera viscosa (strain TUFC12733) TaxID=1330018 RepID=A0A167N2D4_CALVF|nr:hypothetical protein CALVIDRAFT_526821 [Calocera viscosa TUFC12733]
MAARQDAERLRQLVQGDPELLKAASEYLARLRMLATTKASFRRPGEFQNCLKAVRSLLVQKSASSSPQKTRGRPASVSFESLLRGVVQEMNRTMQEWERLLDKAKGGKYTAVDDPRYTKAIFVWVLTSLKYPMDKAAFCAQQDMRTVDLTNILQSLDSRCFARKAALEKKTELHYHGLSRADQDPTVTPTKSLKRKASTMDMPEMLPSSTQSARSGRSSNPFTPSPTKLRARLVSPEPLPLPTTLSDSEQEDDEEGRSSPPPPPKYRLRPLFLETLGLSKVDNMREVEWFRTWRAEVIQRGFESASEDEIEEFDEDEDDPGEEGNGHSGTLVSDETGGEEDGEDQSDSGSDGLK